MSTSWGLLAQFFDRTANAVVPMRLFKMFKKGEFVEPSIAALQQASRDVAHARVEQALALRAAIARIASQCTHKLTHFFTATAKI